MNYLIGVRVESESFIEFCFVLSFPFPLISHLHIQADRQTDRQKQTDRQQTDITDRQTENKIRQICTQNI